MLQLYTSKCVRKSYTPFQLFRKSNYPLTGSVLPLAINNSNAMCIVIASLIDLLYTEY